MPWPKTKSVQQQHKLTPLHGLNQEKSPKVRNRRVKMSREVKNLYLESQDLSLTDSGNENEGQGQQDFSSQNSTHSGDTGYRHTEFSQRVLIKIKQEIADEDDIDYHELYLQRTKRNPKVPKGNHACVTCGKSFVYYSQLRQHHSRHAVWICEEADCKFEYHDKTQLFNHLKNDHGKKKNELLDKRNQECPVCFKRFDSPQGVLEHHRADHDAKGKYPCKHCGKPFFYWQSRKTHQKSCGKIEPKKKPRTLKTAKPAKTVKPVKEVRVKRAYRRRVPLSLKKDRKMTNPVPPPPPMIFSDDEDTMSADSLTLDSDTPLDLSMKTGKIWNTTLKEKDPSKLKESGNNNTAVSSLPSVNTGLSEEAQQQVLQRVMERRDFLLDIDTSTANPDVVMMCNAAVEQARRLYFGDSPYYSNINLACQSQAMANFYLTRHEIEARAVASAISDQNFDQDNIDVVGDEINVDDVSRSSLTLD